MSEPTAIDPKHETAPVPGEQEQEEGRPGVALDKVQWLAVLAACFALTAAMLAAYHVWVAPRPQTFGQIDMEGVLKGQQRAFADLIAKGKGDAAYDLASRMGPRMAQAMQQVETECGCVLLVGNAVIGSGVQDWTARLQQILSVSGKVPAQGGQAK